MKKWKNGSSSPKCVLEQNSQIPSAKIFILLQSALCAVFTLPNILTIKDID